VARGDDYIYKGEMIKGREEEDGGMILS